MSVKLSSFDQYGPAEWYLQLLKSDAFKDVVKEGTRNTVGYQEFTPTSPADIYGISFGQTASEDDFLKKLQAAKNNADRYSLYHQSVFFGNRDIDGDGLPDPGSFEIHDAAVEAKMRQTWGSMDMWVFLSDAVNDAHLSTGDGGLSPQMRHYYSLRDVGGKKYLQFDNKQGGFNYIDPVTIGLDGEGSDVVYQALVDKLQSFFAVQQLRDGNTYVWDSLSVKVNDHGTPSRPFAEPQLRQQLSGQNGETATFDLHGLVTTAGATLNRESAQAYVSQNVMFGLATNGMLAGAIGIDFDAMTVTFPREKADEFILRLVGKYALDDAAAAKNGLDPYQGYMPQSRQVFINDSGSKLTDQEGGEITSSRHTYWKLDRDLNPTTTAAAAASPVSPKYGSMTDIYDNTLVLPLVHDDLHGARVLTLQELAGGLSEDTMMLHKALSDEKLGIAQMALRSGSYTLPQGLYPASEEDMQKWLETIGPAGGYVNVLLKSAQSVNSDAYAQEQDNERDNSIYVSNNPHLLRRGNVLCAGSTTLQPFVTVDFFYQPISTFENYKFNDVNEAMTYEQAAYLGQFVDLVKFDYDVDMRRVDADLRGDNPAEAGKDFYSVRYDRKMFTDSLAILDAKIAQGKESEINYLGKPLTHEGALLMRDFLNDASSRDVWDSETYNPLAIATVGGESWRKFKDYSATVIDENRNYSTMFVPDAFVGLVSFGVITTLAGILVFKVPVLGRLLINTMAETEDRLKRRGQELAAKVDPALAKKTVDKFSVDLVEKYRGLNNSADYTPPLIGRRSELSQALSWWNGGKLSALALGEAGMGKSAAIEGLAFIAATGHYPPSLEDYGKAGVWPTDPAGIAEMRRKGLWCDKLNMPKYGPKAALTVKLEAVRFFTMVDVLAGASYQGEPEGNMKALITYGENNPTHLLAPDEIADGAQVKSGGDGLPLIKMAKSAMSRTLRMFATAVPEDYRKSLGLDRQMDSRFATKITFSTMELSDLGLTLWTTYTTENKAKLEAKYGAAFKDGGLGCTVDQLAADVKAKRGIYYELINSVGEKASTRDYLMTLNGYLTDVELRLSRGEPVTVGADDIKTYMATRPNTEILAEQGKIREMVAKIKSEQSLDRRLTAEVPDFDTLLRNTLDATAAEKTDPTAYLNRLRLINERLQGLRTLYAKARGFSGEEDLASMDEATQEEMPSKLVEALKSTVVNDAPTVVKEKKSFAEDLAKKFKGELGDLMKAQKVSIEDLAQLYHDRGLPSNPSRMDLLKSKALKRTYTDADIQIVRRLLDNLYKSTRKGESLDMAGLRQSRQMAFVEILKNALEGVGDDAAKKTKITEQILNLATRTELLQPVEGILSPAEIAKAQAKLAMAVDGYNPDLMSDPAKVLGIEGVTFESLLDTAMDPADRAALATSLEESFDQLPGELDEDFARRVAKQNETLRAGFKDALVDGGDGSAKAQAIDDVIRLSEEARARSSTPRPSPDPTRTAAPEPTRAEPKTTELWSTSKGGKTSLSAWLDVLGASDDVKTQLQSWLDAEVKAGRDFADAPAVLEDLRTKQTSLTGELKTFINDLDRLMKAGVTNTDDLKKILTQPDPYNRSWMIAEAEASWRAPIVDEIWETGKGTKPVPFETILKNARMPEPLRYQAKVWLDKQVKAGKTFNSSWEVLEALRKDTSLTGDFKIFVSDLDRLMTAKKDGLTTDAELKSVMAKSPAERAVEIAAIERKPNPRGSLYQEDFDDAPSTVTGKKGGHGQFGFEDPRLGEMDHRPRWERRHDASLEAWREEQLRASLEADATALQQAESAAAAKPQGAQPPAPPTPPAANAAPKPPAASSAPTAPGQPPVVGTPNGAAVAGTAVLAGEVVDGVLNSDDAALVTDEFGNVIELPEADIVTDEFGNVIDLIEADNAIETAPIPEEPIVSAKPTEAPVRSGGVGAMAKGGAMFVGEHGSNLLAGVGGGMATEFVLRGGESLTGVQAPESVHFGAGLAGGTEASYWASRGWAAWAAGGGEAGIAAAAPITRGVVYGAAIRSLPFFMAGDFLAKEAAIDLGLVDRGSWGATGVGFAGGFGGAAAAEWTLARMGLSLTRIATGPVGILVGVAMPSNSIMSGADEDQHLFEGDVKSTNTLFAEYNEAGGLKGKAGALTYEGLAASLAEWGVNYRADMSNRYQPISRIINIVRYNLEKIREFTLAKIANDYLECANTVAAAKAMMKAGHEDLSKEEIDAAFALAGSDSSATIKQRLQSLAANNSAAIDELPDAVSRSAARALLQLIVGPEALTSGDQAMLTYSVNDPMDDQTKEAVLGLAFKSYITNNKAKYTYYVGILHDQASFEEADTDGNGVIDDIEQMMYDQENAPVSSAPLDNVSSQSTSAPGIVRSEKKAGYTDRTYRDIDGQEYGESIPDEVNEDQIDEDQELYDEFYNDMYSKDES